MVTRVELEVDPALPPGEMLRLRDLLVEHPGEVPVTLRLRLADCTVAIAAAERYRVRPEPSLIESIEEILGPGSIRRQFAA
jgi:hypothetical protein